MGASAQSQKHELMNGPPESSQHQELSLGAPEYAVGLLLVKHLCTRKREDSRISGGETV